MKNLKFYLALWVAKFTKLIIKIFGKIFKLNGSHFPGNVANKICPNFLEKIGKPKTIITVTGTNGKTTTCNLIIDLLEKNGYKVLNNRFGSNVRGGVTTSLLSGVNIFNKPKYEIAVLEVDERSSAKIYPYVKPTYAVITNLFRDSLKRNAHSEYIFNIINEALPDSSTLILNADDLISNRLKLKNKRVYFGIDKLSSDTEESINIVNDVRICPNCSAKLKYNFVRYHHIGSAYCEKCGYQSPKANYSVNEINFEENYISVSFRKDGKQEDNIKFNMISDSIFNIYNQIVAITVLKEIGIETQKLQKSFENIEITRDRYKKENINGINIINHLAKGQNPVACSIVFKYLKEEKGNKELILLIEDFHDNKESSENIAWLYDTDFEFLNDEKIEKIIAMGTRGEDLKFRLLLAGVPENKIVSITNEDNAANYLSLNKNNDIYILYDMYEQSIVDNVNQQIKEKIFEKEKASKDNKSGGEA